MEHDLRGFLDESKKPVRDPKTGNVSGKGDFYVVAAAVILHGDLQDTRAELRTVADDLGVDVHYSELSRKRRIAAVERIAAIETWEGYLFETAKPLPSRHNSERRIRAHTMKAAFTALGADGGVVDLILETRGEPSQGFTQLDEHDHQLLQSLKTKSEVPHALSIRHETKTEPLLWLADVVAGARTDHLCNVHTDIYPRLAYRIHHTREVLNQ